MKNKISLMLALLLSVAARADEGMWMVNAISKALVDKMEARGLKLSGNEIYNADAVSLKDAIVSLDFGCTGSMVSANGLLITNHHCAYGDVHALSTPEHNYLEDGYWAYKAEDEIHIPGKSVQFLQSIIDVTDEVNAYMEEQRAEGKPFGMRKVSFVMEKKYSEQTGLEASLSSMWSGSKYYMALYKVYRDVRLVAAPPVSIAAFGGDIDNWEWPQHKCDFAMYRIYTDSEGNPADYSKSNIPFKPSKWLQISTQGYGMGDFAMVMGYPGRTDRYSSSAKVDYMTSLSLPITNQIRGEQMEIISRWMNEDPAVRLMYADRFFSLSNVQELQDGEVACCERFKVVKAKRKLERRLRSAENRQLLKDLDDKYQAIREAEKNSIWYRETLVRSSRIALIAMRLRNSRAIPNMEEEYKGMDMRVEKELFFNGIRNYVAHVDSSCWGSYQKQVIAMFTDTEGRIDADAVAGYLWVDRYMTREDPLFRFMSDVSVSDFNKRIDKVQGSVSVSDLGKQYTRALYAYRNDKGIVQYPDANSTMRLTYGTVSTFRRDGRKVPIVTYSHEILGKEDRNSYDFTLKDEWRDKLKAAGPIPVNFITDNDITGGNSGSPVMNGRGELIGLAFDGNKESLTGDVYYTPVYTKCVCVDIRFVLWTLDTYAGMSRILDELQIN